MPSPRPRTPRLIAGATLGLITLLAACTTDSHGHGTRSPGPVSTGTATSPSRGSGSAAAPGTTSIDFSDCSHLFNLSAAGIPQDRRQNLDFDCGRVPVPLDYAHPDDETLSVEVIRIHDHHQTQRIGSLLVNPGGPGGSGVFLAISLAASLSEDMLRHFDLVGFDPRGVGLSSPVKCYTDAAESQALAFDGDVRTATGMAQAKRIAAGFAQNCSAKYGDSLAHYNTVETARDMDRVRAALGDDQMNYLGFSYGTELGAVYAHLFPKRIRVAVLDGAVDPKTAGNAVASNEQQIAGFESAFDQFAADCTTRKECKPLGSPRAAVEALERKANAEPIPTSVKSDTRRATGGNVLYAVIYALYSQDLWPSLTSALLDAQRGDAKGVFELSDRYSERGEDGHYSNLLDVFQVVSCNDQKGDPSDATIRRTAQRWAKQYPLFGLWSAPSLLQCQAWQKQRHPLPPETATGSRPILVVGNLHDPATPYAGAVNLAQTLRTGVLLSWDGEGHTSYGESKCIDDKVDSYLITGEVPPPHTTCPR